MKTHMSNPPEATRAILIAALPALLSECAILPPSSLEAARVWNVLHLLGKVGEDLDEPYSTAILGLAKGPEGRMKGGRRKKNHWAEC
jgi:hypothetical protein